MKQSKRLLIFRKAPFPAIMTIISFVLFIAVYWFVTVTAIEPYYFKGLIFAIPFVCFGMITLFSATGKLKIVISSVITVILIFVLGFAMFLALVFVAFDTATTVTTDIGKYEKVLKMTGYPNSPIAKYFPGEIPSNAKKIVFSYNPACLQGGENFNLKFETDTDSIKNCIEQFTQKAKWIGKPSDNEVKTNGVSLGSFHIFGYNNLPEDFTIYLIVSQPYHPNDWNHGALSLVAISKERNEIIFLGEHW
jgi:hypothetical protein